MIWWLDFRRVLFCFQAEDGIRDDLVTGVQTCALPISLKPDMCSGLSTYCKECTREIDRDRSKTEARIASHKAYAERNKERINERQRDFYTRNKELFYTHNRKRKARLVSVGGAHTRDDIARLLKLQKHRCAYCRCSIRKSRHIDHIVPLKLGGSNDWTNLQALRSE